MRKEKGNKSRSHDWTKKAPKPCEVLQRFIAKLNESMKTARKWAVAQVLEKNLKFLALKYGTCLIFSWNIVVIIVQSGSKLHNFTMLAAGVETEQVCNLFAQRSHHVRVWSNWRQNRFELEEVIFMHLRSKITVARNIRIHHHSLLNAKRKMQLFSV